ncbi:MAG: proline dehydrogenase family protein, partial [Verrucomicrobiota bacterium]
MPASFIPSTIGLSREPNPAQSQLEKSIQARARDIFAAIEGKKPSVFDSSQWMGKLMNWAMNKPDFRVRLLRFVDAYPSVTSPTQLHRLIQEYFVTDSGDVPTFLKLGAQTSGLVGKVGHSVMNHAIRKNLEMMAYQFIVGSDVGEAMQGVQKLRSEGYAVILDLLGEAVVTEKEAEAHLQTYLAVLDQASDQQGHPLGAKEGSNPNLDWDSAPLAQISVKPSALYSLADPKDFEGSVEGILKRLRRIVEKAQEHNAAVCLDMESYRLKDISLEVFRRLRSENPEFEHLGIVLQAYLRDTEADLRNLLGWMRSNHLPSAIRLVKGAYWDYETVIAAQNGWANRVWEQKQQTDANFEKCSRILLENSDICYFACASHNIRSIAVVLETAREMGVAPERFEFQLLYGMAEPVRDAIRDIAGRVRLYAPFGELIPGMAYLVRRILENTANQSFLRATFGAETDMELLLRDPVEDLRESPPTPAPYSDRRFQNEPVVDFTNEANRVKMREAIDSIRASRLGREHLLIIDGKRVETENFATSTNPNRPTEVIGRFCTGTKEETRRAIDSAKAAFPNWKRIGVEKRAAILRRAADRCGERRFELAAWAVLEVGKQWDDACGEIDEMIDFFRYYAQEAERLSSYNPLLQMPGESNALSYEPRGVAAVIAPWNFPFAISAGMISGALATGNTVVFKPSSLSAITGSILVEILEEAGLPNGVLNFVPGAGREVGAELNTHP